MIARISMTLFLIWAVSVPGLNAREIRLTYRLKWLFNASVAGDILARDQGYFRRAGLDVDVKEGSPEKNAIKELELGYADFGVASADQVIRALEKGADVVVLAQIFQINPMQWIYRADRPKILTLADLKGRSIGITYGGNDETIMNALLALSGLKSYDVKIVGVRFDFTPFLKKTVEVWPVYRNSQGVILEEKLAREGEHVRFLNPAGFGVRFVANSVVTSGKMMKERPLLASAFMTALMKAWEDAMDPANEEKILEEVMKKDKTVTEDLLRKQIASTRDLVRPDPGIPMGSLDVRAWQQTEAIMRKEALISRPVHVETRLQETGVNR